MRICDWDLILPVAIIYSPLSTYWMTGYCIMWTLECSRSCQPVLQCVVDIRDYHSITSLFSLSNACFIVCLLILICPPCMYFLSGLILRIWMNWKIWRILKPKLPEGPRFKPQSGKLNQYTACSLQLIRFRKQRFHSFQNYAANFKITFDSWNVYYRQSISVFFVAVRGTPVFISCRKMLICCSSECVSRLLNIAWFGGSYTPCTKVEIAGSKSCLISGSKRLKCSVCSGMGEAQSTNGHRCVSELVESPWVIKNSCTRWGSRKWHHN